MAGMIVAIGLFAKGTPGFVPRGTIYQVTTRRDKEVELVALRPPRCLVVWFGAWPARLGKAAKSSIGNYVKSTSATRCVGFLFALQGSAYGR
jgi:hypothetical protein